MPMDLFSSDWLLLLSTSDVPLKILLGAVFGLCMSLTGVGGGILLIPVLQICFGMHAVLAVGTASMISALVKVSAAVSHIQQKNVAWRQTSLMLCGAVPVTWLTTQGIMALNSNPQYAPLVNQAVESCILLIMAGSMLVIYRKYRQICTAETPVTPRKKTPHAAVFSGMFCGSILGSTGIGGGVLILPILNSTLGIDIKRAVGSAVILSLLLSAITAISYSNGGEADMATALLLVIGSFAGVPAAGYLLKRISEQTVYLITLSIVALSLLLTLVM